MARTWLSKTNGAAGTLNADIDDVQSTATLHTGEGLAFPSSNFCVTIGSEIILVSSRTDDTLTIIRGREGTAKSSHLEDSPVELRVITKYFTDLEEAVDDIDVTITAHEADTDAHGTTGAIVGTTNTQTLTNKTLSTGTVFTTAILAALKLEILDSVYPVGCVYTSLVSTNPATTFGVGTWSAHGVGKSLVGLDSSDTDFNSLEKEGGSKTISLTEANLPSHLHTVNPPATSSGGVSQTHTHRVNLEPTAWEAAGYGASLGGGFGDAGGRLLKYPGSWTANMAGDSNDHTHSTDIAQFNSGSVGSGTAHSNLSPYTVVYFWKRVA